MEFVNSQPGGLNGLIQRFQRTRRGRHRFVMDRHRREQADRPDTITNVLGSEQVGALAQKAGVSGDQLSGMLATVLPNLVDRATPNGEVPAEGNSI